MPETKFPSPSGKYLFHIFPWEARMSLWVESFALVEASGGAPVFSPKDSNWSLDGAQWLGDERVTLRLRRYPGDHVPGGFELEFDGSSGVTTFPDGGKVSAAELDAALERLYAGSVQKPVAPLSRWQRLANLFRN